jgi:type III restriction enzyme
VADGAGLAEAVDDREEAWKEWSVQQMAFGLARELTELYVASSCGHDKAENVAEVEVVQRRAVLFPQILGIIRSYIAKRVDKPKDVRIEEINLEPYREAIKGILVQAIRPDVDGQLLPVINPYRPKGSSRDVRFRTGRMVEPATKSHLNCSVLDNIQWERMAIAHFEQHPTVLSYVRNDHLGFSIPYHDKGARRSFEPDFIVRCRRTDGKVVHVIVEIKGYQRETDGLKRVAAQRWVEAVNNHGGYGLWAFIWCENPDDLPSQIADVCRL